MSNAEPVSIDCSFSLEGAVRDGFANEAAYGHLDAGPVDTMSPAALKRALDEFYGASPLNSLTPSPSPSRPLSPDPGGRTLLCSQAYGTSMLSDPEARELLFNKLHEALPFNAPAQPRPSSPPASLARGVLPHASSSQPPLPSHLPSTSSLVQPATQPPAARYAKVKVNSKNRRNRNKGHEKRHQTRKTERDGQDKNTAPHPRSVKRIKRAEATETSYDTASIPSASTGFVARRDTGDGVIVDAATLLQDPFFQLIRHEEGKPRAFVDKDGRVVAVAAGHPDDLDWDAVQQSGHDALTSAATRIHFPKKARRHRRGNFPALSVGISHGGGQTAPGNLQHVDRNVGELDALIDHPSFGRIAGFASSVLHTWAPKLHDHYAENLDAILEKHPGLRRNYLNSIFAAVTFNFGPRTCSKSHRDYGNLPYGWCAITALGSYDYTRGGHLVLWDLGLIIEFPPGSTILIPSAAITHSNTPIGAHETRTSFAQFTAGGLFRWRAHGFQTDEEYFKGKTAEELDVIAVENEARSRMGLSLFSTFKEIEQELHLRGAK